MKTRNFCFTQQVGTFLETCKVTSIDSTSIRYYIYGREVAPSTGQKHLQGFVCFVNAKTLHQAIRLLNPCHVEAARGSIADNITYCKKDGAFTEYGTPPHQGEHTEIRKIHEAVMEGKSTTDIAEEFPGQYMRLYRGVIALQSARLRPRNWPMAVYIFWGAPGSGKTRLAAEVGGDAFWKDPVSTWWDGYTGQDTIIIDDFNPAVTKMSTAFLLRAFDRYSMSVEVKGGTVTFAAKKVILTSMTNPAYWFAGDDSTAFHRRITEIVAFPCDAIRAAALRSQIGLTRTLTLVPGARRDNDDVTDVGAGTALTTNGADVLVRRGTPDIVPSTPSTSPSTLQLDPLVIGEPRPTRLPTPTIAHRWRQQQLQLASHWRTPENTSSDGTPSTEESLFD